MSTAIPLERSRRNNKHSHPPVERIYGTHGPVDPSSDGAPRAYIWNARPSPIHQSDEVPRAAYMERTAQSDPSIRRGASELICGTHGPVDPSIRQSAELIMSALSAPSGSSFIQCFRPPLPPQARRLADAASRRRSDRHSHLVSTKPGQRIRRIVLQQRVEVLVALFDVGVA